MSSTPSLYHPDIPCPTTPDIGVDQGALIIVISMIWAVFGFGCTVDIDGLVATICHIAEVLQLVWNSCRPPISDQTLSTNFLKLARIHLLKRRPDSRYLMYIFAHSLLSSNLFSGWQWCDTPDSDRSHRSKTKIMLTHR